MTRSMKTRMLVGTHSRHHVQTLAKSAESLNFVSMAFPKFLHDFCTVRQFIIAVILTSYL